MVLEVGQIKAPVGPVSILEMVSSIHCPHGGRADEQELTHLRSFIWGLILFECKGTNCYLVLILTIFLMLTK